jgi:dipeptidase E
VFATSQGDVDRILVMGQGAGLVDFAVIPHLEHPDHPDASLTDAEWVGGTNTRTDVRIDDQTAIRVVDGAAQVVAEGHRKLFQP